MRSIIYGSVVVWEECEWLINSKCENRKLPQFNDLLYLKTSSHKSLWFDC